MCHINNSNGQYFIDYIIDPSIITKSKSIILTILQTFNKWQRHKKTNVLQKKAPQPCSQGAFLTNSSRKAAKNQEFNRKDAENILFLFPLRPPMFHVKG
jgi:hypothetical protein